VAEDAAILESGSEQLGVLGSVPHSPVSEVAPGK